MLMSQNGSSGAGNSRDGNPSTAASKYKAQSIARNKNRGTTRNKQRMFSGANSNMRENFSSNVSMTYDQKIMTMSSVSQYNKKDLTLQDAHTQQRTGFN